MSDCEHIIELVQTNVLTKQTIEESRAFFSKMVADKTFIDVSILAAAAAKLTEYNMHMYYKGLVTLTFKDGFMQTF